AATAQVKTLTDEKNARPETTLDAYNQLKTSLTEAEAQEIGRTKCRERVQTERDARPIKDEYEKLNTKLTNSQAQVTKLEGQIATLKDRPDTTQTAYDEIQAQLKSVHENITTLSKERNAATAQVKTLTDEKNARPETTLDAYNQLKTSLTEAEAQ